jgi:DNA topoisomerase-3
MVESGELTLDDFVTKQSTWIAGIVNKYQQQPFNIKITVEKTPDCTLCGSPTRRRPGKNGDFFGCSKYPECKGIINIEPKKKSKQAYKKKD